MQKRVFFCLFLIAGMFFCIGTAVSALQFLPRYQGTYIARSSEGGRESGFCNRSLYPFTLADANAQNCTLSGTPCVDIRGDKYYPLCTLKTCHQLDYYCLFTAAEKSLHSSRNPELIWTLADVKASENCYRAGCPTSWSSVSRCKSYSSVVSGSGVKSLKSCLNSNTSFGSDCLTDERYTLTCHPGYILEKDHWVTGSSDVCEVCEKCPAGYKCDGTKKTQCPAGTQSSSDGTDCIKCKVAYANPTPGGVCEVCSRGVYSDTEGATECLPCPLGSFKRTGTVCKTCASVDAENLPGATTGAYSFSTACRCKSGYTWNGSETNPKCTRPECTAISCTGSTACGGKGCTIFKPTAIASASDLGTGVKSYASCSPANCDGDNYQYGYLITACSEGYALSGGSCSKQTCEQYNADYVTAQPSGYQCTPITIANGNTCYVKSSCEKIVSEFCHTGEVFNGSDCIDVSALYQKVKQVKPGSVGGSFVNQTGEICFVHSEAELKNYCGKGFNYNPSLENYEANFFAVVNSFSAGEGLNLESEGAFWTAFYPEATGDTNIYNNSTACYSILQDNGKNVKLTLPSLTFSSAGGAIVFVDIEVSDDLVLNGPVAIVDANIKAKNLYINGTLLLSGSTVTVKNIYLNDNVSSVGGELRAANIIISNIEGQIHHTSAKTCYPPSPNKRDVVVTADNIYNRGGLLMPSIILTTGSAMTSAPAFKLDIANNSAGAVFSELSTGILSWFGPLPAEEYQAEVSVGGLSGWNSKLFNRVHIGYNETLEKPAAGIIFRSAGGNQICSGAKESLYVSQGNSHIKGDSGGFITCKKLDCTNVSCRNFGFIDSSNVLISKKLETYTSIQQDYCNKGSTWVTCDTGKEVCPMSANDYLSQCDEYVVCSTVNNVAEICEEGSLSCYDCQFKECYDGAAEDNYCDQGLNDYWSGQANNKEILCVSSEDAGTTDARQACEALQKEYEQDGITGVVDFVSVSYGTGKCISCLMSASYL